MLQQVGFGYTVNASKEHCAIDISNNLNHVQQTNSGRGAPAASTAGVLQVLPLPVPVARPEGLYTICPALSVKGEDLFTCGNSFSLDLVGHHP